MNRSINLWFGVLVAVVLASACKTNRVVMNITPLRIKSMPTALTNRVPDSLLKLTFIPVSTRLIGEPNQKAGSVARGKLHLARATLPASFTTSIQVKGYLGIPVSGDLAGRIRMAPLQTMPTMMTITSPSSGSVNVNRIMVAVGNPKVGVVKNPVTPKIRPNFLVAQQWQRCLANQHRPNLTSLGQPLPDSLQRKGLVPGYYRLLAAFMQPRETGPPTKALPKMDTLASRSLLRSMLLPVPVTEPQSPVSPRMTPTKWVPAYKPRNKREYPRLASATRIGSPVLPPAGGRGEEPLAKPTATIRQAVKTSVEAAAKAIPCTDLLAQINLAGDCASFSIGIAPTLEMTTWSSNASVGYLLLGAAQNQIAANDLGYFVIEQEPGTFFKKEIGLEARGDTLWICRPVLIGQTRQTVLTLFVRELQPPKNVARRRKFLFWSRS